MAFQPHGNQGRRLIHLKKEGELIFNFGRIFLEVNVNKIHSGIYFQSLFILFVQRYRTERFFKIYKKEGDR